MPKTPEPARTLESDVGGAITGLALQIRADTLAAPARRAAYASLITALGPEIELAILADDGSYDGVVALLAELGSPPRAHVARVPGDLLGASTAWMRDGFLQARDGASYRYLIVRPPSSTGRHATWLGAADGRATEDVLVALEGGDCLVGDGFRLVGVNAVTNTMSIENHPCDHATALARIRALDPRPLHVVGYRERDLRSARGAYGRPVAGGPGRLRQEWAHIDLVVALTGRQHRGRKLVVVASTTMPPCVADRAEARMHGDCLDALAVVLRETGFAVVRNPAPYSAADGTVLPYNNALVQRDPDVVWLPQFADGGDYAQFDRLNVELWHGMGFRVVPVAGWGAFLRDHASIRCATNAVARRPSA